MHPQFTARGQTLTVAILAACLVIASGRAVGGDDPPKPGAKTAYAKSVGEATQDLRQLVLAVHKYHDAFRQLPPAALRDKAGHLTLSWRVQILPYLKEDALFREFKVDEPWDSDNNKKLIAKMPAIFRGPNKKLNDEGKTVYLAPIHNEAVFRPDGGRISISSIYDGTKWTVMFVEVNDDSAVVWTKPADMNVDLDVVMGKAKPLNKGLIRSGQDFFLVAMCDGSVHRFRHMDDPAGLMNLRRVFGRQDGEVIDFATLIAKPNSAPKKATDRPE
jgi:hypothetical protein